MGPNRSYYLSLRMGNQGYYRVILISLQAFPEDPRQVHGFYLIRT